MTTAARGRTSGWSGYLAFAAIMMVIVGMFNALDGVVALFKDQVFVVSEGQLVAFDVTTWGWIHLIVGIGQIIVALALFSGVTWARICAIAILAFNALAQLAFANAYPAWALVIIALDILTIWALTAHGNEIATM
jgi:hypothetical protein